MADENQDHDDAVLAAAEAAKAEEDAEAKEEPKDTPEPSKEESKDEPEDTAPSKDDSPDDSASEDKGDDAPVTEEPAPEKPTRKERRAERRKSFLESIQKDTPPPPELPKPEDYNPLKYEEAVDSEGQVDTKKLEEDREKYAKTEAQKAANEAALKTHYQAEQQRFWDSVTTESKSLVKEEGYEFLNEDSEEFDADKAERINGLYLTMVGHDQKSGTARRTDLSYDKFVREYVGQLREFAEEEAAKSQKNIAKQASNTGVRPDSKVRTGPSIDTPGDIRKLSDEEFEKNEKKIMAHFEELRKAEA